jgi:hypothetical protein
MLCGITQGNFSGGDVLLVVHTHGALLLEGWDDSLTLAFCGEDLR